MEFYQFKQEMTINASLDEVWDFISSPKNLKEITPDYMDFNITTKDLKDKIYPGMIISYKVKPILGIKLTWVSEITQVQDKKYFIDEQRVGPYKLWHHQHFIEPVKEGVLMTDLISYMPPYGIFGRMFIGKIKNKLNQIFEYRTIAINKKFNKGSAVNN